jgi:NADH-quinone oxidoreductase subunit J
MPIAEVVFYTFSLVLTGAAVMVITVRNPVYAALFLVLAFFSSAAIWMLLEVEFLAIVLVLVYVGAVMVLFLFVVMMLDINGHCGGFIRYLPAGLLVALSWRLSSFSCSGRAAASMSRPFRSRLRTQQITAIPRLWANGCTHITCCHLKWRASFCSWPSLRPLH